MTYPRPPAVAVIVREPLHAVFSQFPAVCFTLVLITDIFYWMTAHLMWHNFSAWLLLAGLVFGAVAVVVALIEYLVPALRPAAPGWVSAVGGALVLVLGILNSFVHAGDGWTGIVPWGLTLSALTVALMIVVDVFGRVVVAREIAEGDRYV